MSTISTSVLLLIRRNTKEIVVFQEHAKVSYAVMDIEDIHVDIRPSGSAEISRSLMPVKYSALIIRVLTITSSVVTSTEWKHTYWIYISSYGRLTAFTVSKL